MGQCPYSGYLLFVFKSASVNNPFKTVQWITVSCGQQHALLLSYNTIKYLTYCKIFPGVKKITAVSVNIDPGH